MKNVTPEQLDAVLPQTQCGLCGHGGCLPYAEAMVFEQAPINLCPPGGVNTLKALGQLLAQDPTSYLDDMQAKTKPPVIAMIREAECIGCTKCINACPVDAIIGSAKHMHTVIANECTGCELCLPACPVDCIDLIPATEGPATNPAKATVARQRFQQHNKRLADEKKQQASKTFTQSNSINKSYVDAALARIKAKKNRE